MTSSLAQEIAPSGGRVQRLVILGWHPTMSANGSHGHWATRNRRHHVDRDMAWASAMQAGWTPVIGKARLTITLVYSRKYRVDADNLAARCKGLIDGLKTEYHTGGFPRNPFAAIKRPGFILDDSTEWLELRVLAEVRPGEPKSTEMVLEQIDP